MDRPNISLICLVIVYKIQNDFSFKLTTNVAETIIGFKNWEPICSHFIFKVDLEAGHREFRKVGDL